MKIRDLDAQDIKEYRELVYGHLATCFRVTYGEVHDELVNSKVDGLIEYLNKGKAFAYGAFTEDTMVGFLWGYPVESIFETVFHIAYIAVSETGRRQGVGKSLLSEAEKQAKELGLCRVELVVGANNDGAIEFYSRTGYHADRYILKKSIDLEN